jgi:hypothetical protein
MVCNIEVNCSIISNIVGLHTKRIPERGLKIKQGQCFVTGSGRIIRDTPGALEDQTKNP